MPPQILVPLDGSPLAEMIVPHARIWAHATGCGITLLQVIPPPAGPDPLTGAVAPGAIPYPAWDSRRHRAQAYMAGVVQDLAATQDAVETTVREGDPATQIAAYAVGDPAVVGIAMTTHSWGGGEGLLGSVAEQVLHNAPQPLLLVPPQQAAGALRLLPARPYRTIVVPLDGSPGAEQALPLAHALAAATGARLRLVTVTSEPVYAAPLVFARLAGLPAALDALGGSYLMQTAARWRTPGVRVETALIPGRPADAIARYSDSVAADLLVLATSGPSRVDRLWHTSVAAQVLQQARHPIVLLHW